MRLIGELVTTRKGDSMLMICFFLILLAQTLTLYSFDPAAGYNFGAEYGRIAGSIVRGEGFANVFGAASGPTAWHPPLTVFFFALVFWLFGTQTIAAIWVLLIFRIIFLTATLYYLLKIIEETPYSKYRFLIVVILLFQIFSVKLLSLNVEDIEIATMLSTMMVYAIISVEKRRNSNRSLTYLLAFVLPLTVPSFALAFAVLLFLVFAIKSIRTFKSGENPVGIFLKSLFSLKYGGEDHPRWISTIIVAGFIFIISASLWTYRNYLVFGQFIPIKSNLWFEFYLANNSNADGLYSFSKLNLDHPYRNEEVINDYLSFGEIAFIEDRKSKAQQYVKQNPSHYFHNTFTRLRSAFVWTDMVKDVRDADTSLFSADELEKIQSTRLLLGTKWTSLNMEEMEFMGHLQALDLQREGEIFEDWKRQRKLYLHSKFSITNVVAGLLLASIPLLFMMVGAFISRIRNSKVFKVVIGIYFIHLLPYLFVSHWYRYQLFLLALQALVMFLVISHAIRSMASSPAKNKRVLRPKHLASQVIG